MAPATLRVHLTKPPGPPEGEPAVRLRKTPAAIAASVAAAALAIAGCSSSGSSSAGSTSSSAAPAQLTVWRMGSSTPAQVTWMNSVVSQFHKNYPAYAKTKVKVVFVPWTNRTQDWTNALSSEIGRAHV